MHKQLHIVGLFLNVFEQTENTTTRCQYMSCQWRHSASVRPAFCPWPNVNLDTVLTDTILTAVSLIGGKHTHFKGDLFPFFIGQCKGDWKGGGCESHHSQFKSPKHSGVLTEVENVLCTFKEGKWIVLFLYALVNRHLNWGHLERGDL